MKRLQIISIPGILLLLFCGCVQEKQQYDHAPGSPIVFGASTYYESEPGTRTEYSGSLYDVSTKRYERIDWVENSDRIRIFCLRSEDGPYSDYAITETPEDDNQISSVASITPLNHYGLHWGTGDHYFYALYPAAGMKSNYQFKSEGASTATDRFVSETDAKIEAVSGEPTKALITGVIPSGQEVSLVSYNDTSNPDDPQKNYDEYKANMNYAYMYARTKVNASSMSGKVTLSFKPLVTAFEFTLLKEKDNGIASNLTEVELTASTSLTGSFKATLSETGDPSVTAVSGTTGSTITVKLPDGGVMLSETRPLKITLLALPLTQTGLTLRMKFANGLTRSLALKNDSDGDGELEYLEVGACKKLYVRNVGVPEYEYHLEHVGPTLTLDDADGTKAQILRLVSTTAGTTNAAPILSFKREIKTTGTPAEYAAEAVAYEWASSDASGNPSKKTGTTEIDWQSWSSHPSALSGFTVAEVSTTSDVTDRTAAASLGAYPVSSETMAAVTGGEDALRTERLLENTDLYGTKGDPDDSDGILDLAFYDFENHTSREHPLTANCYIVDRAGTFSFPLVYGNAIDWTRDGSPGFSDGHNKFSYTIGDLDNEIEHMHCFWASMPSANATDVYPANYLQQSKILSPYIVDQTGVSISDLETVVVWEDVSAGNQFISDLNVFSNDASYIQGQYSGKTAVPYLRFTITREKLRQGNAVIGIRKRGQTVFLWSWHIWVTDGYDQDGDARGDGFTPVTITSSSTAVPSNEMFQTNIGWCPYNGVRKYPDKVWYVRIHQEAGRAEPLVFKVIQAYPVEVTEYFGNETYYQWGRKDPFLPSDGYSNARMETNYYAGAGKNKSATSTLGVFSTETGHTDSAVKWDVIAFNAQTAGHVYFTIQHPHVMYVCTIGAQQYYTPPGGTLPQYVSGSFAWGSNYNWLQGAYPHNFWNMRNGSARGADLPTSKTIYDPCPPGYCVPNKLAFSNFTFANSRIVGRVKGHSAIGSAAYAWIFTVGGEDIFFPLSGVRTGAQLYSTDPANNWMGEVHTVGGDGVCWTAAATGAGDLKGNDVLPASPTNEELWAYELNQRSNSMVFYFDFWGSVDPSHYSYRSHAYSVRPVKEKPYNYTPPSN